MKIRRQIIVFDAADLAAESTFDSYRANISIHCHGTPGCAGLGFTRLIFTGDILGRERLSHAREEEMQARIHVITLAVSDLGRALAFYRDGLGLESTGVVGTEFAGDEANPAGDIALFHLYGGLILALYPRTELAKDAHLPYGPPKSGEFSIGHAVGSKEDVDAVLAMAEAAGATVTGRPHDRPWGIYSGYFRDLDGHLWEILWNPQLETT